MRVLLRQSKSRLYYAGPCAWTCEISNALGFKGVEEAMERVRIDRVPGMEVVLSYDFPRCDLILPAPVPDLSQPGLTQ